MNKEAQRRIEEAIATKATGLDLSECELTVIPEELGKMSWLVGLNLSSNQLSKIEGLEKLTNLDKLRLDNNQLTKIEGLDKLANLIELTLHNNELTRIEGIEKLTKLAILRLDSNRLIKMEGLEKLTNLTLLWLDNNELTKIEGLEKLTNLTAISLDNNELTKIEGLDKLRKLNLLWLNDNQLTKIEGLDKLTKSTELRLENNTISDLWPLKKLLENDKVTVSLEDYDFTKKVFLKGNPITNPPLEIVAQGTEAILRYWEQLEATDAPVYLNEARILIVGEGEAGKTTLQRKLIDRNAPMPDKDNRTRKIVKKQITTKLEDGTDFILHLWDFGGQNIQYYAHQFFLSTDAIYLLVADERRQSHNFVYWLHIIELLGKGSPIFLLQNQKDDAVASGSYSAELQKHFPVLQEELGINLKNICDLDHPPEGLVVDDNLRTNSQRFETLIAAIAKQAAGLPLNTAPRPASFRKVRELVIEERQHKAYRRLDYLLEKEGAPGKEDFIADLKTLTIIGECVYNHSDPLLKGWVFLNPQWIIDAMYRLIDNSELEGKRGQFTEQEADQIWNQSEYEGMTVELIRLLRNFYLCYQIQGGNTNIAPMLLPVAKEVPWPHTKCFRLYFEYQFLPYGILTRLICRLYDWIVEDKVWRDAVILQMPDAPENTAYLRESFDQKQIILDVHGPEIIEMVQRIRKVILDIHQEGHYHKLQFGEFVPCPCRNCQSGEQQEKYPFSYLLEKVQQNKSSVECRIHYNDVPLAAFNLGKRNKSAFILAHPKDQPYVELLQKHLAAYKNSGELELHSEKDIPLGQKRSDFITSKLSFADVVFLLISPDLQDDNMLYQNMLSVIERSRRQAQRLVPIRLADGVYGLEIEELQCLPRDGSSLRSAKDPDEAWMKIAQETGGLLFPDRRMGRFGR